MFWDKWIPNKYLVKSTICGLEIFNSDSGLSYNYIILKKLGNKLEIIESGNFESISELPKRIRKEKIPIVLNFTGKGIILKKTIFTSEEELESDEFIHQNLPAVTGGDFCIQIIKQKNNTCFISLVRKNQMEIVIGELSKMNHDIAGIILGPASTVFMLGLISNRNFLNTNHYKLEILNDSIESISGHNTPNLNENIEIETLKLYSNSVFSFASAFSYLTFQSVFRTSDEVISNYRLSHVERNKLRTALYFFVGLFLLISVTNFLFFNNYFTASNKLQSELDVYESKYEEVKELLNNYEKKKGLIEQTGLLEEGTMSKYSDKIAATIPEEIVLTEFYVNPELKKAEEDSLINFQRNTIFIRGNCDKSYLVNEWISVLKSQDFVREVNLEQFLFKNESNQPNFILKIIIE